MIFMTVGKYESFYPVLVFQEIRDIRNDQVDPVHIIFGERKTTVDYQDGVLVLECGDIHTDGFQSAKRYDLQF